MRSRLRKDGRTPKARLRPKITVMLIALFALWIFAAWVTWNDAGNLWTVQSRDNTAGRPTKTLINVLQVERRATLVQIAQSATRSGGAKAQVRRDIRVQTDRYVEQWRKKAFKADQEIMPYVKETDRRLRRLAGVRDGADAGAVSAASAAQVYNDAIDAAFRISRATAGLDDPELAADGRALIELTRAREMLAREDATVAEVLTKGRLAAGDYQRVIEAISAQRQVTSDAAASLSTDARDRYERLSQTPAYAQMERLQNRLRQEQRPNARVVVRPAEWQQATEQVLQQWDETIDAGGDRLVERSFPMAAGVIGRLTVAGGLGLVAVIASAWLAFTALRNLARGLSELRSAAEDLTRKLPHVVERLRSGERVDVDAEVPPLKGGGDDIDRVAKAFNELARDVVSSTVREIDIHNRHKEALQEVAQRPQALVRQALSTLDELERRPDLGTEELRRLFVVDNKLVLIGRFLANLQLLSGGRQIRGLIRPRSLYDLIRAAIGEVEDYDRVVSEPVAKDYWVIGPAVDDLVRVLAELIENGLKYSPSQSPVQISVTYPASGVAIEIVDHGLGLTPEKLEEYNHLLANPPAELDPKHMGLYVVAQCAKARGIQVTLMSGPYGGVQAVVLLPQDLLTTPPAPAPKPAKPPVAGSVSGGHAAVSNGGRPQGSAPSTAPQPTLSLVRSAQPNGSRDAEGLQTPATGNRIPQRAEAEDQRRPADNGTAGRTDEGAKSLTENGLPIRRPQESLAEPLREPTSADAGHVAEDAPNPEEVRRRLSNYQRLTRQGRADAQRTQAADAADAPAPAETTDRAPDGQ
ncbi:hypothetical protein Acsp04_54040 [Actinomadura sp. NBRC 104425]|uniref:sensor histidine kinase n=1 Tax=Actinomadura sp. NBRC 104425 TaxID=3032204 RepID=UPI0024A00599|nr:nitrate- and nitrite sensing domain-containing protein [Actinomadura sp. NBRC 104425]GLZ15169.1 hypothetical protein Acsp04_54040 [Actinomadura sp. NBRC 104425]